MPTQSMAAASSSRSATSSARPATLPTDRVYQGSKSPSGTSLGFSGHVRGVRAARTSFTTPSGSRQSLRQVNRSGNQLATTNRFCRDRSRSNGPRGECTPKPSPASGRARRATNATRRCRDDHAWRVRRSGAATDRTSSSSPEALSPMRPRACRDVRPNQGRSVSLSRSWSAHR